MSSAFFDVPRGIAHLLKRRVSHNQVYSERWQCTFVSPFDHHLVAGEILGSGILYYDICESCLLQRCLSLGRRNQVRPGAVGRPRYRVMGITGRA